MDEEFFSSPFLIVFAGLLEFRRCGVDEVREQLLWNCFYEGTEQVKKDEVLSAFWKDEWFYRSEAADKGLEYYIPALGEDIYFHFKIRKQDFPHLGLGRVDIISFYPIQLLAIQRDLIFTLPETHLADFEHPFYRTLCSTIQSHVKEEAELLRSYNRDMNAAEKAIMLKYRIK